jgi:hypothetical protein
MEQLCWTDLCYLEHEFSELLQVIGCQYTELFYSSQVKASTLYTLLVLVH